jgi:hypothetical protein
MPVPTAGQGGKRKEDGGVEGATMKRLHMRKARIEWVLVSLVKSVW